MIHELLSKIRATLSRRRRDAELDEEIESHIELLAQTYRERDAGP